MGHSFINGMVSSVAQPVLAQVSNDKERQLRVFRKMMRFTCFISFPAMFGLSFVAPELITITITDKWAESAKILQLLCISGAFIPVINLCSNLLISKGKSNIYMWNTISLVIFQLFVMLLCHPYGIHTMIIIYVAINISWLLIWHHFVQKEISYSLNSLIKDITPFLLITTGAIAISYFCMEDCDNIYLKFAGEIGIVAILYLSTMWATGSQTLKEGLDYLLKGKKV